MSPPPDNRPARPPRFLPGFWRVVLLVVGTGLGSLLVAGPMILSEWDSTPGPARMRIMIALIMSLLLLPGVLAGFWWKPLGTALAGLIGPAMIAAVIAAQMMNEDYSYLKVGVPAMIAGGLLITVFLPGRRLAGRSGLCRTCGYDLRGTPDARCSECGAAVDDLAHGRSSAEPHYRWVLVGIGGFAVSAVLCYSFVRFLLTLG